MPLALLPASAQAFAPRAAPTIVLNTRVEKWLTESLKRVNRVKRPLNSVTQHYRCLTETLSGPSAIWSLASLMVPRSPDADLRKDGNALVEAIFNYQMLHVEGYVVHVDMVSAHEIAFKLTQDSIDALVDYHTHIFSVDTAATTWDWPDKDAQLKKLREDFKQAINRYVFRTHVRALEGLEEDGAGELLEGRSDEVKNAIFGLFLPLLPPPPRIVDVVRPSMMQPHPQANQWWQSPVAASPPQLAPPAEPWRVLGSNSPSPTTSAVESNASSAWSQSVFQESHTPSPSSPQAYSQSMATSAGPYYSTAPSVSSPLQNLPMPSLIAQQCNTSPGNFNYASFTGTSGGFPWGSGYNDFMHQAPFPIST